MARLFKQTYVKTRTEKDTDGRSVRVPVLDADGKPVLIEAKRWTVEYYDAKGRRRRKVGYTDKAATESLAASLQTDEDRVAIGMRPVSERVVKMPIAEMIQRYKAHLTAAGACPAYVVETDRQLRVLAAACGFRTLVDVKAEPVERFLETLRHEGLPRELVSKDCRRPLGPLSAKTRNAYLAALRAMLTWAKGERLYPLGAEALAGVVRADEAKGVVRKRRAFTDDELRRLFTAAHDRVADSFAFRYDGEKTTPEDRDRLGRERVLMYKVMIYCGLRKAELEALRWAWLDLDGGWLEVPAAIAKGGEDGVVAIRRDLVEDLREWRAANPRAKDSDKVFRVPKNLIRVLNKDLTAAGILKRDGMGRTLDVHALRTTCGTRHARAGGAPAAVQAQMRHADYRTTQKHYIDLTVVDAKGASESAPGIAVPWRGASKTKGVSKSG